jgi:hypothetical protein
MRIKPKMKFAHAFPVLLVLSACAVRLGGSKPMEYDTVAIAFDAGTTPEQAATRLRELGADLALVAARADTAWVRQLAQQTRLVSSRPGQAGDYTLAFLAFKPVGDTTLTLNVDGGGKIRLHDALYNIDKSRRLDLMTAVFDSATCVRDGVRTLLNYIATDVMSTAAVALAVQAPTQVVGDSIALLTRAAIADAWECSAAARGGESAPAMDMRLFYFPAARMRCESARVVDAPNRPIVARLIVP